MGVINLCSLCSQADGSLLGGLALRSTWEHGVLLELQREPELLGSAALAGEPALDSGSWLGPPGGREVCDITVGLQTADGAALVCDITTVYSAEGSTGSMRSGKRCATHK